MIAVLSDSELAEIMTALVKRSGYDSLSRLSRTRREQLEADVRQIVEYLNARERRPEGAA